MADLFGRIKERTNENGAPVEESRVREVAERHEQAPPVQTEPSKNVAAPREVEPVGERQSFVDRIAFGASEGISRAGREASRVAGEVSSGIGRTAEGIRSSGIGREVQSVREKVKPISEKVGAGLKGTARGIGESIESGRLKKAVFSRDVFKEPKQEGKASVGFISSALKPAKKRKANSFFGVGGSLKSFSGGGYDYSKAFELPKSIAPSKNVKDSNGFGSFGMSGKSNGFPKWLSVESSKSSVKTPAFKGIDGFKMFGLKRR